MAEKILLNKILVIQTAFIGDVILATALLEKLHNQYQNTRIDILVRKGNEALFDGHPFLHKVLILEKKTKKAKNFLLILQKIRQTKYDLVINCHRFLSSGLFTVMSGAKYTVGYDKNPLSSLFSKRIAYNNQVHEIERNQMLIEEWTSKNTAMPKLYPPQIDITQNTSKGKYITISPASVWLTKQFPKQKWIKFINTVPIDYHIFLLGGVTDIALCEEIKNESISARISILSGKIPLLQSAAYMKEAKMNYVNDSAPMHLCSSVNAPVCAIYCSTIPAFGFGPLSLKSHIIEIDYKLYCRPCGLHGYMECPEGHFKCARDIEVERLSVLIGT